MEAIVRAAPNGDAWELHSAGLTALVSPPVLYGISAKGAKWTVAISFADCQHKHQRVDLPDGPADALVLSGSVAAQSASPGLVLEWTLILATRAPGVVIELHLTVAGHTPVASECKLEHVVLGAVELTRTGADGRVSASGPTLASAGPTKPSVAGYAHAVAMLCAVATVASAASVASARAILAVVSPAAAAYTWWRARRRTAASGRATFLINGWQSFSFSGAIDSSASQPVTSLPFFSGAFHTGAEPPPRLPTTMSTTAAAARPPPPSSSSSIGGGDESHVGLKSDLFGILKLSRCDGADGAADAVAGGDGGEEGGLLLGYLGSRQSVGGVATLLSNGGTAVDGRAVLFSECPASLSVVGSRIEMDAAMIIPFGGGDRVGGGGGGGGAAQRSYADYIEAVASRLHVSEARAGRGGTAASGRPQPARPTPVGWCSWYCHGPNVSEELMLGTITKLGGARASAQLPLELVQLDDGWQVKWGDWLTPHPKRFPRGLRPVTAAAKMWGMRAGLWIAPAALTSDSRLLEEHPEWVLRRPNGKPLKCGWTAPGLWIYALDVTHPDALRYVREVVGTATREWGFEYLKLDFLHTAAMPGGVRHDPNIGRAEALHLMLAAVREEVGEEVFLLACGAPLGPCIGHVDGMRVSADAATHWLPTGIDVPGTRWMFAHDRTNLPAARNMVRNVGVRLPMGGRLWRNDPDCLILRHVPDFSIAQARALAAVAALSAGALIFSDPPDALPAERFAILQALVPPLPRAAVAVDLMGQEIPAQLVLPLSAADSPSTTDGGQIGPWWLAGLFNWSGAPSSAGGAAELSLSSLLAAADAAAAHGWSAAPPPTAAAAAAGGPKAPEAWHAFDFWSGTYERLEGAAPLLQPPRVPPRCCWLVALRPALNGVLAQLVGTNIHISCGLEILFWTVVKRRTIQQGGNQLEFKLHAGRTVACPRVWVHLSGTNGRDEHPKVTALRGGGSGDPAPTAEFVSDGVWVLSLCPIGTDGISCTYRVDF